MKIFLDSGAFSAWRKKAVIALDEYISFIQSNGHRFHLVACLDVIGDPEASYANWVEMKAQGVESIPCFHIGEDWKWLDRYIDEAPYIAFGGIVGTPAKYKVQWMDKCWKRLNREKHIPKTHCFGCTELGLMARYPWTTVDSSTWLKAGVMGEICLPGVSAGTRLDYTKLLRMRISDRESADVGHVRELGPRQYEAVRYYVEDVLGGSMEALAESTEARQRHNAQYFRRLGGRLGFPIYMAAVALPLRGDEVFSHALISYWGIKNKSMDKVCEAWS